MFKATLEDTIKRGMFPLFFTIYWFVPYFLVKYMWITNFSHTLTAFEFCFPIPIWLLGRSILIIDAIFIILEIQIYGLAYIKNQQ